MPAPKTPLVTVDIIIEMADVDARPIVLIERRHEPLGWALPGGFVDVGESLEQAAVREAWEETSLAVRLVALLGCYSAPQRDPRGHTVSAVYVAEASGTPRAADDARRVRLCAPPDFPPLAFDHGLILQDYLTFREQGLRPPPRL
jgi:8-oxo-dGTP diphosphatase